ncbi:MAG: hypothetical protein KBD19_03320 [Candidatus Moranbacteria bacterium]|nr:hypothetical protein [Candidatus Moranbacteria bacterium]
MYKRLVFFDLKRNEAGKAVCGSIVTPHGISEEFLMMGDACSAVDEMEHSGRVSSEEALHLREEIRGSGLPEDGEAILHRLCDSGVLGRIAIAAASRKIPAVSGGQSDPIYDRNGKII